MSIAGKIVVDLETRTSGFTKGLDQSGGEIDKWAKGISDKFKKITGGDSLGKAVNVVAFATAFQGVSTALADVATKLRTGSSAADAFSSAVNSIPIVGQFKQAGEAIRELFTGEQALLSESLKVLEINGKIAASYRGIAAAQSLRGKYGDERASAEIDVRHNDAVAKLQAERGKIAAEIAELDGQQEKADNVRKGVLGDGVVASMYDLTEAQKIRRQLLQDQLDVNKNATVDLTPAQQQEHLDLIKVSTLREYDIYKSHQDAVEDLAAQSEAKALKAQGKALEARLVMNKREQEKLKDNKDDEIVAPRLDLLGLTPAQRQRRIDDNRADLAAGLKSLRETAEELTKEQHRREQEEALDNVAKLREIEAAADIERFKMRDEAANAFAEKNGQASRSHLAEAAAIEEEYTKQATEIGKKNREQYGSESLTFDDNYIAQQKAAKAERDAKMQLLKEKSGNETLKNQENSLREQRKLWEQVGTPAQAYAGHLEDINEQFAKYHDLNLKDAQVKDLDKKTLADLKKQNPDHDPKVDLYGRTGSYAGLKVGGSGEDIAREQLELMKKKAAAESQLPTWIRDIWDYVRTLDTGAVQEITI